MSTKDQELIVKLFALFSSAREGAPPAKDDAAWDVIPEAADRIEQLTTTDEEA